MAPLPDYVAGTITLTNNSTAFTGSGTGWLAAGFREGDTILGIEDNPGVVYVVESVTDNDSGTLTQPWDGPTGTYTYRMRYLSDGQRVTAQARQLIEMLGNGNLQAVAGLPGTPNTLMMFTGAGSVVEVPRTDLVSGANYDVQVDTLAERAAYDGSDEGFAVLVANTGDGRAAIYSKLSNAVGDWSDPAYVTGPAVTLDVGSVTPVAFGNDPDVTLNPVAGGYEFDFELPENATFQSGTITTLDPGEDATFSLSPVAGGYALNLGVPRGPTGDIDGVTPFWQGRITVDADAEAARAGLGAASLGANTFTGLQSLPTNSRVLGRIPYFSFVTGVTRQGFIGRGDEGNGDFYVGSDIGNVRLVPASGFNIVLSGVKITGLAAGVDPNDAVRMAQIADFLTEGDIPDDLYRPDNILGTVSQSSGVPTGAVIERGSNSNGQYIKFADGTMICTHRPVFTSAVQLAAGSWFRSGSNVWTFPAAFSAIPVVSGLYETGAGHAIFDVLLSATYEPTTTTADLIFVTSASKSSAARSLHVTAIGRWF